jgi:hypothetical protein
MDDPTDLSARKKMFNEPETSDNDDDDDDDDDEREDDNEMKS